MEEDEGSIIQIVVVGIGATTIENYVNMIYPISKKLLGWFYSSEFIERGYIQDNAIPVWMKDISVARKIMMSR